MMSSSEAEKSNRISHFLGILVGVLALFAAIFNGMALHKVSSSGFCTSSTVTSIAAPSFDTTSSISVPLPTCGAQCQVTAQTAAGKVAAAWWTFDYLLGELKSIADPTTGNTTLYSSNLGPINYITPLLCNFTQVSNVTYTVMQYYPETKALERVATTVPMSSGTLSTCINLNQTSAAYKAATLFGTTYTAVYGPVYDAITNEFIGALFAGYAPY